jgi:hypothetical protein
MRVRSSSPWIIQNIGLLALSCGSLKCSSSHGPTPAVWPQGWTLLSAGGPCLSVASWFALPRLASVLSNEARWGVNLHGASRRVRPLLGPFAGTKGPRLPGRNPATQEITWTRELGRQVRCVYLPTLFDWQNPR